jgi:hypothetical protein
MTSAASTHTYVLRPRKRVLVSDVTDDDEEDPGNFVPDLASLHVGDALAPKYRRQARQFVDGSALVQYKTGYFHVINRPAQPHAAQTHWYVILIDPLGMASESDPLDAGYQCLCQSRSLQESQDYVSEMRRYIWKRGEYIVMIAQHTKDGCMTYVQHQCGGDNESDDKSDMSDSSDSDEVSNNIHEPCT